MRSYSWLTTLLVLTLSGVTISLVDGQKYNFKYSDNPHSNPWIRHSPGSDPAAYVWGDTVWVYVSMDANLRLEGYGPDAYKYDYMDGYRALSSTDMVNWVDHGEVLHSRNVAWGARGWMWAPAAHWNGKTGAEAKYYLYYPHKDTGGTWRIGVATASTPAGPFTDIGYPMAGLSGIDPHIFQDDDKQIYLYYNQHEVVKLKDSMIEIAEPVRKIDYGQSSLDFRFQFEEGSYMHKYKGKYYYSYSHWHPTEPTMAYYAIGTSPYGPFEWKGALIGRRSGSQDHHSIIQFKGDWYYFTHMDTPWKERSELNWYGQRRISCYQKMYYNSDGTIRQVDPNSWALNAGESGPYISAGEGVEFYWDQWYSYTNSNTRTIDSSVSIANTVDDAIYRSNRWGSTFTYSIPVENNMEYLVTFKFAEVDHNAAGMRKFNVALEGETKITNLDVFAKAGGKYAAYDETHTITVQDHVLNIQFTASVDSAMISGMYIRPKGTALVPTKAPVRAPTKAPVHAPTKAPTKAPVRAPTKAPSKAPTKSPTKAPVHAPTKAPVRAPTKTPTKVPTKAPTKAPVHAPTKAPTKAPVPAPTKAPVNAPTKTPTKTPSKAPTNSPVRAPTKPPVHAPTKSPTKAPTKAPVNAPTKTPTDAPTKPPLPAPTKAPVNAPTNAPTTSPTKNPVHSPTKTPVHTPTAAPTRTPTKAPLNAPTDAPTKVPTKTPTTVPVHAPTMAPSKAATNTPTKAPVPAPTKAPALLPTRTPSHTPTSAANCRVVAFRLWNANTDTMYDMTIANYTSICHTTDKLAFEAVLSQGCTSRVFIGVNGPDNFATSQWESRAPYMSFSNSGTNVYGKYFPIQSYNVTAYPKVNESGGRLAVNFINVVNCP